MYGLRNNKIRLGLFRLVNALLQFGNVFGLRIYLFPQFFGWNLYQVQLHLFAQQFKKGVQLRKRIGRISSAQLCNKLQYLRKDNYRLGIFRLEQLLICNVRLCDLYLL